jgi:hypothetical protein
MHEVCEQPLVFKTATCCSVVFQFFLQFRGCCRRCGRSSIVVIVMHCRDE